MGDAFPCVPFEFDFNATINGAGCRLSVISRLGYGEVIVTGYWMQHNQRCTKNLSSKWLGRFGYNLLRQFSPDERGYSFH